jgi:nucleotide-binding universal stress UspA family protein
LLATDGSREAELAARTAADIAKSTSSELHVVNVAGGRAYYTESREITEQLRQRAGQLLDEQVEMIKEAGGTVAETHIRVVAEHRDRGIVELAEELGAGLIAMGSRGQGGVKRALLGSVSDSVVRHAHCPVLVVREEQ